MNTLGVEDMNTYISYTLAALEKLRIRITFLLDILIMDYQ